MGKGSRQRTLNTNQFNDNYDQIFGVKDEHKRVPHDKEEEYSHKHAPKTEEDKAL